MEYHLISIVIVNYRRYDKLKECLISVAASYYHNFEVIVVDNSSDQSEIESIKKDFKSVKFFPIKENLNYAEGNNFGISKALGDFIVVLNNDTVVEANWLQPLVDAALLNPNALYQPKILFLENPDLINSFGNAVHVLGFAFPLGINTNVNTKIKNHEITEVFYCSGACLFASKRVLEKLGGFDSNYWTYYEDVNLGWRGRLLGFRSYVVPLSTIYHSWGASHGQDLTPKKLYLIERGRLSSLIRNYSMKSLLILFPFMLFLDFFLFLYLLRVKGLSRSKLKASLDVAKNLRTLVKQRRKIQKARIISDKELSELISPTVCHPYVERMPGAGKNLLEKISLWLIRRLK